MSLKPHGTGQPNKEGFPVRKYLPALLMLAALSPACANLGAGTSVASLGPDAVASEQTGSTLRNRLVSGLVWLWKSCLCLERDGVDVHDLWAAAHDVRLAIEDGDLSKALALWGKARVLVTTLSGVAAVAGS